jgi:hypothetical protein
LRIKKVTVSYGLNHTITTMSISYFKLWVRIPLNRGVSRYNIMWWSLSVTWQVGGFSLGTPISSTNKNDRHDITEILLKVSLSTITLTPYFLFYIAEILLKVALNTKNQINQNPILYVSFISFSNTKIKHNNKINLSHKYTF